MSFLARREANAGRPPENLEGFRRRGDSRVVELKGERHRVRRGPGERPC
jgi:hypothetical protein